MVKSTLFGSGTKSRLICDIYGCNRDDVHQVNSVHNSREVLLDPVVTTLTDITITEDDDSLLPCDLYHSALLLEISDHTSQESICTSKACYDFRKADFVGLNNYLETLNWDEIVNESFSLEESVRNFYNSLHEAISIFVTLRRVGGKLRKPSWNPRDPVRL